MNELTTLYRYRQLLAALTARDLKARYRGSILGFFWSLANPLLLLGVYTVVFTIFFPQQRIQKFICLPFSSPNSARRFFFFRLPSRIDLAISPTAGSNLGRRPPFRPRLQALVVVLLHLRLALALPILFVAMGIYAYFGHATIPATAALIPFLMLLQTIFVAGIVMCVSSAAAPMLNRYTDLRNLMQPDSSLIFRSSI